MTLRVTVDLEACQGYACCMIAAPAVFDMDEGAGKAIVLREEQDDSQRELLETAARGCPAHAITVEAR
jgi:ferredoxin